MSFYGMIILIILTVFIAGLMVGRTPEYLGKKIKIARGQARDDSHGRYGFYHFGYVSGVMTHPKAGIAGVSNPGLTVFREFSMLTHLWLEITAVPSGGSVLTLPLEYHCLRHVLWKIFYR